MLMANTVEDARLFKALSNENNLRLLSALFDGEKALDEIDISGADVDELEKNQLIRTRTAENRRYIRINKVGKFRAMGVLESYLKTASDMAVCGIDN